MSEDGAGETLSRCKIRLRQHAPYFAVLTLFALYRFDPAVALADTDGRTVRLNPDAFLALPDEIATGLLLHVTLHAALLHPLRQRERDPLLWNIACDIMVNSIISTQTPFPVPPGTLVAADVSASLVPVTAEQVYEYLLQRRLAASELLDKLDDQGATSAPAMQPDQLRKNALAAAMAKKFGKALPEETPRPSPARGPDAPLRDIRDIRDMRDTRETAHQADQATTQQHWESALWQAREQESARQKGKESSTWLKELEAASTPQLDWRSLLSRFVINTPSDYAGMDLRFVHAGLYLETLAQETVHIDVAIDTSASIDAAELDQFAAELVSILGSYPSILCHLYFCDRHVYGPFPISSRIALPAAHGGGGTDFRPFFAALDQVSTERRVDAAIYFTDGEGDFPERGPDFPVLWVAIPGAIPSEQFPFGQVIRLA